MGIFGMLLGAAAVVVVAAVSFVSDELSQQEKRKQQEMNDEYERYKERTRQEYHDISRYYADKRASADSSYASEIMEYQKQLIAQKKKENKKILDNRTAALDEQYSSKSKLLDECRKIVIECEKSIQKSQNTYVRFKSIKATLISLQEAVYKLEAYLKYLEDYKKELLAVYKESGDISEPFSYTLPVDYPYEGKIVFLEKSSFGSGYGHDFGIGGYIFLSRDDNELLNSYSNEVSLPFMIENSKSGKKYLSLSKGILKNSIGGAIGIDADVVEVRPKSVRLKFGGANYLSIWLDKNDMKNPNRKTPIDSSIHVYIKDYDFALKKRVFVSERFEDGLSIVQFSNIVLLHSKEERDELHDYLKENNLLEKDDEWRIGPIYDENNALSGLILQVGHLYAIKTFFEEISQGNILLRYCGMLPKEEMMSFDDVFVTTNVTLVGLTPETVKKNSDEYQEYFDECQKLKLYLITEFASQSRILNNSPMSLYLDQWSEVTNRLIEIGSYGTRFMVSVLEWNYFSLQNTGVYTMLFIENGEKLMKAIDKEKRTNRRPKFFIALSGEETEKLPCEVITENDEVTVRVKGKIDSDVFLQNDFRLEMYALAIPYAEKQQAAAFSAFKEGRVANMDVKAAIINTSGLEYDDNENRIVSFFNGNIKNNKAQNEAVQRAFAERRFFLIQGPPGTGKTTVIKELILQQLNKDKFARILVVSQANVAVDNVLRGIAEISEDQIGHAKIVRCGTPDKIAEDIEKFSFDNKYAQYMKDLSSDIIADPHTKMLREKWLQIINDKDNSDIVGECFLNCFQIIGATCVGLKSPKYGLSNIQFDLVIIDEAGKGLAGELLIPINHAKKVIIIGDHKQLPPVINPALYKNRKDGNINLDEVVEEEQQPDFLNKSFFQRLYEDCPDNLKCMLNIQFRMPPVIADLVNMFYDNSLQTGDNCKYKKPMFLGNNLIFIDMKNVKEYKEQKDNENGSPYNPMEAEAVVNIVRKVQQYYQNRIVVITPYKKQRYKIIESIRKNNLRNVWVNTIDAFQGDEEDLVIYCTTRAIQPTKYFSDNARLNVAFSRTKNTLIFLGSSDYLKRYQTGHILRKISKYLMDNAAVVPYSKWLDDNFDLNYDPMYNKNSVSTSQILKSTHNPFQSLFGKSAEDTDLSDFFESVKKKPAEVQKVCKVCGSPLEDSEKILCSKCIHKNEYHKCKCCSGTIVFPYYNKYVCNDIPPEICEKCETVNCSECGQAFYIMKSIRLGLASSGKLPMCSKCKDKYRSIAYRKPCTKCGKEITLTYAALKRIQEQGKNPPSLCKECNDRAQEEICAGICKACSKPIYVKRYIYEKRGTEELHKECADKVYKWLRCATCGDEFSFTYRDKLFYDKKGYTPPKRCPKCRSKSQ